MTMKSYSLSLNTYKQKKRNNYNEQEKNQIQLLLLIGICIAYVSASVIPDAVFVELDHDLHDVGEKALEARHVS